MRQITFSLLCCAAIAVAVFSMPMASGAQSAPTAAPTPSGQTPGAAAPGAAGGGPSYIESTILEYQGLQLSADAIAQAIKQRVASSQEQKIVVATPSDVTAILQLHIVLSQIEAYNARLTVLKTVVDKLNCAPTPSPPPPPRRRPTPQPTGAVRIVEAQPTTEALAAAATSLGSVLTTVASFTATSETTTSQSATFLDTTLIDLVAESITSTMRASVYVPSLAPPSLTGIDASTNNQSLPKQTYLFGALKRLDKSRVDLEEAAEPKLSSPKCKKNSNAVAASKLVVAALAVTEKFEASIFGVSGLPATGLITAIGSPEPKTSEKPGAAKPSVVTINLAAETPAAPPAPSGPSALQRLLYVDLLVHQLGGVASLSNTYLLAVQALEAGGSKSTKGQIFSGTRDYFSGGAIASFALVNGSGSIACSGIAYGYRGQIRSDDFSYALQPTPTSTPAVVTGTNNALPNARANTPQCPRSPQSP